MRSSIGFACSLNKVGGYTWHKTKMVSRPTEMKGLLNVDSRNARRAQYVQGAAVPLKVAAPNDSMASLRGFPSTSVPSMTQTMTQSGALPAMEAGGVYAGMPVDDKKKSGLRTACMACTVLILIVAAVVGITVGVRAATAASEASPSPPPRAKLSPPASPSPPPSSSPPSPSPPDNTVVGGKIVNQADPNRQCLDKTGSTVYIMNDCQSITKKYLKNSSTTCEQYAQRVSKTIIPFESIYKMCETHNIHSASEALTPSWLTAPSATSENIQRAVLTKLTYPCVPSSRIEQLYSPIPPSPPTPSPPSPPSSSRNIIGRITSAVTSLVHRTGTTGVGKEFTSITAAVATAMAPTGVTTHAGCLAGYLNPYSTVTYKILAGMNPARANLLNQTVHHVATFVDSFTNSVPTLGTTNYGGCYFVPGLHTYQRDTAAKCQDITTSETVCNNMFIGNWDGTAEKCSWKSGACVPDHVCIAACSTCMSGKLTAITTKNAVKDGNNPYTQGSVVLMSPTSPPTPPTSSGGSSLLSSIETLLPPALNPTIIKSIFQGNCYNHNEDYKDALQYSTTSAGGEAYATYAARCATIGYRVPEAVDKDSGESTALSLYLDECHLAAANVYAGLLSSVVNAKLDSMIGCIGSVPCLPHGDDPVLNPKPPTCQIRWPGSLNTATDQTTSCSGGGGSPTFTSKETCEAHYITSGTILKPCNYAFGECIENTKVIDWVDVAKTGTKSFVKEKLGIAATFENCLQQIEPLGMNLLKPPRSIFVVDQTNATVPFNCNDQFTGFSHTLNPTKIPFFVLKESTNMLYRCNNLMDPSVEPGFWVPLIDSGVKVHGCPSMSQPGVVRTYEIPSSPSELPFSSNNMLTLVDSTGNTAPEGKSNGNSDSDDSTYTTAQSTPVYICMGQNYLSTGTSQNPQTSTSDMSFKTLAEKTSDKVSPNDFTFLTQANCANQLVLYGKGFDDNNGNNGYNDLLPVPCVWIPNLGSGLCVPDLSDETGKVCAASSIGNTLEFYNIESTS